MDWLILVAVVPMIVVPIVLLCGFAGCTSFGAEEALPPPATPFALQANAVGLSQIDVTWQHNSAGGIEFVVARLGPEGVWNDNYKTVQTMTLADTMLAEGTPYFYRVRARAKAGGQESLASDPAGATTWKWEAAYDKPLALDGGNFAGDCMVQRIDKALLTFAGKARRVRITLRGSTTGALAIDRVYISQAAPATGIPGNPTPNPWDSNSDLTKVFDDPLAPLALPANSPATVGPIDYALNRSQDLIIAFDVNAGAGAVRRLETGVAPSTCYINGNAAEAAKADRTSAPAQWSTRANTVYLVERIDVLTG